jgi:lipopolysaccharide/colanic/teichoic acid biosynthesis glycosyltransferase
MMASSRATQTVKRFVDVVVAGVALVLTSPVLLLCIVAIRLTSSGPAVFRQERVGRHRQPFVILKFRSMYQGVSDAAHREQAAAELAGEGHNGGAVGYKDARDPRVTPVGRVLRAVSLDELPQLVNVLRGDMSLVGPRPSLPYEAEQFPAWAEERFEVRPGITGLWQVSGRNHLSMLDMLELDCQYVRSMSMWSDLGIMLRTVPATLSGEGAA